jgi:hypothetical protein
MRISGGGEGNEAPTTCAALILRSALQRASRRMAAGTIRAFMVRDGAGGLLTMRRGSGMPH